MAFFSDIRLLLYSYLLVMSGTATLKTSNREEDEARQ